MANGSLSPVRQLDRILRGEATRLPALREGTIDISPGRLAFDLLGLGMLYGVCMGCFALLREGGAVWVQLLACLVKVPALFFLTLLVTFPSLYVFNALVGSRLSLASLIRLLLAAMAVMLAVLASFGTIVAFFSFTTQSYSFMVLLNVLVFAVSGFLGLGFLLQTLHRLSIAMAPPLPVAEPLPLPSATPPPPLPQPGEDVMTLTPEVLVGVSDAASLLPLPRQVVAVPGALDRLDGQILGPHVKTVFRIWVIVFGLVGAQMSWVLRPFIGNPDLPFAWFRPRGSNFFESIFHTLGRFLGA